MAPPDTSNSSDSPNNTTDDSSDDTADNSSVASASPYSMKDLKGIVADLQAQNAEYRNQIRKLTSGMSTSASTGSAATSISSDPIQSREAEFDKLGRTFCILHEIWPNHSHFTKPYPENLHELGPWHAERYRNDKSKHDAAIAELYQFVPDHLHDFLEESPTFAKKFIGGAKSMRSYIISNVRKSAHVIFPINAEKGTYEKGHKRSNVPEIIALLWNPARPDDLYPRYPPLLYKDGILNVTGLFCGSAIINILKIIFLGPTSLTRNQGTGRSGPKAQAASLELKVLTPGSIAMAAVIARFILSDDMLFQDIGAETKINYHEEFDHYKKFLLQSFDAPRFATALAILNQEVLGIIPHAMNATSDGDIAPSDDTEEARLMAELWGEPGDPDVAAPPQSPEHNPTTPPSPPSTSVRQPEIPTLSRRPETPPEATSGTRREATATTKKPRARKPKGDKAVASVDGVTEDNPEGGTRKTHARKNRS